MKTKTTAAITAARRTNTPTGSPTLKYNTRMTARISTTKNVAQTVQSASGPGQRATLRVGSQMMPLVAARRRRHSFGVKCAATLTTACVASSVKNAARLLSLMAQKKHAAVRLGEIA